ncbi:MAG: hypothetical protein U0353_34550 [Sandaracinus sp.]
METSYGIYDWFEYAYDVEGRVLGERYPDGRETSYEYETATGRLAAQRFPAVGGASVQNFTRNWYDNVVNGQHAERVIQIAHEFTAGTTAFAWASGMVSDAEGRITQAQLYDQLSFPAARTYRTDGRVASTSARYQTGALTMAYAMERTYSYSADGSAVGWTTGTTNDVARTLFYDMSNRLLCETSVSGSTSCPTTNTSPFLEAFTYDATDSRLTYRDSTGTTNYTYNGVAMTAEDPPGTWDRRQFYALTSGGVRTSDRDNAVANTTRTYTYDALQRLRQVTLTRPGTTVGTYQSHLITVHYDHRARPYYVTVLNQATGVEERNRYYYGLNDELIEWIRTPNSTVPTTYDERQYVPIGDFVVGEMFRSWAGGTATRRTYYHAVEPMGLELAAWEFEHPGGPAVTYNPQTLVQRWSGFGRRMYISGGGVALPTRFPGQIELRASDVWIWSGSNTTQFADPLYLNRWRVYDPRVGQYLQPDPAGLQSWSDGEHVFAYAEVRPQDANDPHGLLTDEELEAMAHRAPIEPWNPWSPLCEVLPELCTALHREYTDLQSESCKQRPDADWSPESCRASCHSSCMGRPDYNVCFDACYRSCRNPY